MLLRFTNDDILNTQLVDVLTGQVLYTIASRASYIKGDDKVVIGVASRATTITAFDGRHAAEIQWTGEEKKSGGLIRIMGGEPVTLADLFNGGGIARDVFARPDLLVLPTRLHYVWVASRTSLQAFSTDTNEAVFKLLEESVFTGDTVVRGAHAKQRREDYLDLVDMPPDVSAELLADFLFVNIMRRTRFDLPKYCFPLVDGRPDGRQSITDVISHVKESFSSLRAARRLTS